MPSVGLFGKMPSTGDFVSRGFSGELRDGLDHLLQAALMSAAADGSDLRQVMASAPPLLAVLRPGAVCAPGFAGLIYPSCDRVGRVFPLCVGLQTEDTGQRMPLGWPSGGLARSLCQVVGGVFQANEGPDELMVRMPALSDWARLSELEAPFCDVSDETVPGISVEASHFWFEGPESSMSLASRAVCSRLPWVVEMLGATVGADGALRDFFGSRSLLSWSSLAALFDARWNYWGWMTQSREAAPSPQALEVDEDTTRPHIRMIDTSARTPDSPTSA